MSKILAASVGGTSFGFARICVAIAAVSAAITGANAHSASELITVTYLEGFGQCRPGYVACSGLQACCPQSSSCCGNDGYCYKYTCGTQCSSSPCPSDDDPSDDDFEPTPSRSPTPSGGGYSSVIGNWDGRISSPVPELPAEVDVHVCTNPMYWYATLTVTVGSEFAEIAMFNWNTGSTIAGTAVLPLYDMQCATSASGTDTQELCASLSNGCLLLQQSDSGMKFAIDAGEGCSNDIAVSSLIAAGGTLYSGSRGCPLPVWQLAVIGLSSIILFFSVIACCCYACCRPLFDRCCCCCCSRCCCKSAQAPAEVGEVVNPLSSPSPKSAPPTAVLTPLPEPVPTTEAAEAPPPEMRVVTGTDGTQYLIDPAGTATPIKK